MNKGYTIITSIAFLIVCSLNQSIIAQEELTVSSPHEPVKSAVEPVSGEIHSPVMEVPDTYQIEKLLRAEMASKKIFADQLWDVAGRINEQYHVGTAFNEVDIPKHHCNVLGRLLDQLDEVKNLNVQYVPDYTLATDENAQNLRIMVNSLNNFISVAEYVVDISDDERVLEWNLDCVGKFDIPRSANIAQTGQSSFYVIKSEGKLLQLLGDIEDGYFQKIVDAIEKNPAIEVVALGSGGGAVYEALRAGQYVRAKGLETTLSNGCFSACPLVFMGGVQRTNSSPYPELGFHQVYSSDGVAIPLDSQVYRDIYRYSTQMGIDGRFVINKMWGATPEEMNIVDGYDESLCDANITTWIQRGCTSKNYKPLR